MEHLKFIDILLGNGVGLHGVKEDKKYIINKHDTDNAVGVVNLKPEYEKEVVYFRMSAAHELIKNAIDMGSWKHSWHTDIKAENYKKYVGIIRELMINRSKEISDLRIAYQFLMKHISIEDEAK